MEFPNLFRVLHQFYYIYFKIVGTGVLDCPFLRYEYSTNFIIPINFIVGADSISARLFLSHCAPHPSAFGCHLLPLEKAWDRVDIESTPTTYCLCSCRGGVLPPARPRLSRSNIFAKDYSSTASGPPSLTREGWGISLSAESDDILFQVRITNGCFDIYHFTTSLPLSGKVARRAHRRSRDG